MNEKIVNKWKPIIECFNYTGTKLSEIAMYMETHNNLDLQQTYSINNVSVDSPGNCNTNLLPVAAKIILGLENLSLENVIFTWQNSGSLTSYKVELPIGTKEEISETKFLVQQTESKLVNVAIAKINEEISNLNTKNSEIYFNTPRLVQGIGITNNNNQISMTMELSYSLKSKIN